MMQSNLEHVRHVKVFAEADMFGGWPANNGMWNWGQEVLVGFVAARHQDKEQGHTYDRSTAQDKFARSLDGGQTWTVEDAYDAGITGLAHDHALGDRAKAARECPGGIDFSHPDFAFTFRRGNNADGPSVFYYSYDRGRSWEGPFRFPNLDSAGFANRTAYLIEGKHQMLAFLTAAKSNRKEGRVACARTTDGGRTWERVAWIGPEPALESHHHAIMPAAVRLSPTELLVMIRWREGEAAGLVSYRSDDNAATWEHVPTPDLGNLPGQSGDPINNPPAMIRLADGRLCLGYGVRLRPSRMCIRLSDDGGQTWSREYVVRGNDGALRDMGYPRLVQRPDGQCILAYYYNHALADNRYRYIAATIFDPDRLAE